MELVFKPWISASYKNKTGIHGQLLILGESHYIEEDQKKDLKDYDVVNDNEDEIESLSNFTHSAVEGYLLRKYDINFFRNLGLLFNSENRYELWQNIAFANGIQYLLSGSNTQPTKEEISTVKDAFWSLLEELNPSKILVCSQRMWQNWLPDDDPRGEKISELKENNKYSTIWRYKINGHVCHAMGINHPSKYFSYDNWSPLIVKFRDTKF